MMRFNLPTFFLEYGQVYYLPKKLGLILFHDPIRGVPGGGNPTDQLGAEKSSSDDGASDRKGEIAHTPSFMSHEILD